MLGGGGSFYKSFFFFPLSFPPSFCNNCNNARTPSPFPIPHEPVVVLPLFHLFASEMLNHKMGGSKNGVYLTGRSPALF